MYANIDTRPTSRISHRRWQINPVEAAVIPFHISIGTLRSRLYSQIATRRRGTRKEALGRTQR